MFSFLSFGVRPPAEIPANLDNDVENPHVHDLSDTHSDYASLSIAHDPFSAVNTLLERPNVTVTPDLENLPPIEGGSSVNLSSFPQQDLAQYFNKLALVNRITDHDSRLYSALPSTRDNVLCDPAPLPTHASLHSPPEPTYAHTTVPSLASGSLDACSSVVSEHTHAKNGVQTPRHAHVLSPFPLPFAPLHEPILPATHIPLHLHQHQSLSLSAPSPFPIHPHSRPSSPARAPNASAHHVVAVPASSREGQEQVRQAKDESIVVTTAGTVDSTAAGMGSVTGHSWDAGRGDVADRGSIAGCSWSTWETAGYSGEAWTDSQEGAATEPTAKAETEPEAKAERRTEMVVGVDVWGAGQDGADDARMSGDPGTALGAWASVEETRVLGEGVRTAAGGFADTVYAAWDAEEATHLGHAVPADGGVSAYVGMGVGVSGDGVVGTDGEESAAGYIYSADTLSSYFDTHPHARAGAQVDTNASIYGDVVTDSCARGGLHTDAQVRRYLHAVPADTHTNTSHVVASAGCHVQLDSEPCIVSLSSGMLSSPVELSSPAVPLSTHTLSLCSSEPSHVSLMPSGSSVSTSYPDSPTATSLATTPIDPTASSTTAPAAPTPPPPYTASSTASAASSATSVVPSVDSPTAAPVPAGGSAGLPATVPMGSTLEPSVSASMAASVAAAARLPLEPSGEPSVGLFGTLLRGLRRLATPAFTPTPTSVPTEVSSTSADAAARVATGALSTLAAASTAPTAVVPAPASADSLSARATDTDKLEAQSHVTDYTITATTATDAGADASGVVDETADLAALATTTGLSRGAVCVIATPSEAVLGDSSPCHEPHSHTTHHGPHSHTTCADSAGHGAGVSHASVTTPLDTVSLSPRAFSAVSSAATQSLPETCEPAVSVTTDGCVGEEAGEVSAAATTHTNTSTNTHNAAAAAVLPLARTPLLSSPVNSWLRRAHADMVTANIQRETANAHTPAHTSPENIFASLRFPAVTPPKGLSAVAGAFATATAAFVQEQMDSWGGDALDRHAHSHLALQAQRRLYAHAHAQALTQDPEYDHENGASSVSASALPAPHPSPRVLLVDVHPRDGYLAHLFLQQLLPRLPPLTHPPTHTHLHTHAHTHTSTSDDSTSASASAAAAAHPPSLLLYVAVAEDTAHADALLSSPPLQAYLASGVLHVALPAHVHTYTRASIHNTRACAQELQWSMHAHSPLLPTPSIFPLFFPRSHTLLTAPAGPIIWLLDRVLSALPADMYLLQHTAVTTLPATLPASVDERTRWTARLQRLELELSAPESPRIVNTDANTRTAARVGHSAVTEADICGVPALGSARAHPNDPLDACRTRKHWRRARTPRCNGVSAHATARSIASAVGAADSAHEGVDTEPNLDMGAELDVGEVAGAVDGAKARVCTSAPVRACAPWLYAALSPLRARVDADAQRLAEILYAASSGSTSTASALPPRTATSVAFIDTTSSVCHLPPQPLLSALLRYAAAVHTRHYEHSFAPLLQRTHARACALARARRTHARLSLPICHPAARDAKSSGCGVDASVGTCADGLGHELATVADESVRAQELCVRTRCSQPLLLPVGAASLLQRIVTGCMGEEAMGGDADGGRDGKEDEEGASAGGMVLVYDVCEEGSRALLDATQLNMEACAYTEVQTQAHKDRGVNASDEETDAMYSDDDDATDPSRPSLDALLLATAGLPGQPSTPCPHTDTFANAAHSRSQTSPPPVPALPLSLLHAHCMNIGMAVQSTILHSGLTSPEQERRTPFLRPPLHCEWARAAREALCTAAARDNRRERVSAADAAQLARADGCVVAPDATVANSDAASVEADAAAAVARCERVCASECTSTLTMGVLVAVWGAAGKDIAHKQRLMGFQAKREQQARRSARAREMSERTAGSGADVAADATAECHAVVRQVLLSHAPTALAPLLARSGQIDALIRKHGIGNPESDVFIPEGLLLSFFSLLARAGTLATYARMDAIAALLAAADGTTAPGSDPEPTIHTSSGKDGNTDVCSEVEAPQECFDVANIHNRVVAAPARLSYGEPLAHSRVPAGARTTKLPHVPVRAAYTTATRAFSTIATAIAPHARVASLLCRPLLASSRLPCPDTTVFSAYQHALLASAIRATPPRTSAGTQGGVCADGREVVKEDEDTALLACEHARHVSARDAAVLLATTTDATASMSVSGVLLEAYNSHGASLTTAAASSVPPSSAGPIGTLVDISSLPVEVTPQSLVHGGALQPYLFGGVFAQAPITLHSSLSASVLATAASLASTASLHRPALSMHTPAHCHPLWALFSPSPRPMAALADVLALAGYHTLYPSLAALTDDADALHQWHPRLLCATTTRVSPPRPPGSTADGEGEDDNGDADVKDGALVPNHSLSLPELVEALAVRPDPVVFCELAPLLLELVDRAMQAHRAHAHGGGGSSRTREHRESMAHAFGRVEWLCAQVFPLSFMHARARVDAAFDVGRVLMALRRYDLATQAFTRSAFLCGESFATVLNIGVCYARTGALEAAVGCFERCVELAQADQRSGGAQRVKEKEALLWIRKCRKMSQRVEEGW